MHTVDFIVTPNTGDVYATEFTTVITTTGSSIAKYIWDFGDTGNLLYGVESPTHIYNYPGVYTISLTAVDYDGHSASTTQQITADLVYRDYIRFTQIPEKYPDPGKLTTVPFKAEVVCSRVDQPLIIDLFATNSQSTPNQYIPERWRFLNPTWKFLDKDQNIITSISATPVYLYKNSKVVGVSSTIEFYYVDSIGIANPVEQCPILITATLQTSGFNNPKDSSFYTYPGYANNQTVRSGVLWQVNDLFPNTLKVTANYIDSIQSPQWTNVPIPFLITCHSNRNLILSGSEDSLSEPIFTYPATNTIGQATSAVVSITNLSENEFTIDEAPLYFQALDKEGFDTKGYIFTTLTAKSTALSASIAVSTNAYTGDSYPSGEFYFPKGFAPNTSIWVSNPEKNTLNKITLVPYNSACPTVNYFAENGILIDGQIKQIEVPHINSNSTLNYSMSGFSGIYGIAIDPRKYDIVACDSELDRLYRISNTGEILKTFELSSLGDYDPFKKMMDYWHFTTPAPELSSTRYALYNSNFISENIANYIISVGGAIQKIPNRYIDRYDRVCRLIGGTSYEDYPLGDLNVDIVQIFNPTLPTEYISTLAYWLTSFFAPSNVFPLTNAPNLSSNTSHYFITVDGVVQNPSTYTVNNTTKSIEFAELIQPDLDVQVLYIPKLSNPLTLTFSTSSETTSSFNVAGINDDPKSEFIVAIGGVYQPPQNYNYNYSNQTITFIDNVPTNTPIQITQLSIADAVYVPAAYTPSYISIDKNYDIWVSLYNTVSVLKFDQNFNLLFSVVPSGVGWQTEAWTNLPPADIGYQFSRYGNQVYNLNNDPTYIVNPDAEPLERFFKEFFLKPPVVETDRENNCWVTYAHPLCCILTKYSPTGQLLGQVNLPKYTIPVGLAINANNDIWVSNTHNSSYTYTPLSGSLQLYSTTTFQPLSTVIGFTRPEYLALDRENNIWFTHGLRRIGYFNTKNQDLRMWTLELTGGFTEFTIPMDLPLEVFDRDILQEDEEINGLAVDVYNRVWVIDGSQNYAWVLSATPNFSQAPIRYFKIVPNTTIGYYVNLETGQTYTESGDYYYKSAQATGDWTGNRWYQKYVTAQQLSSISLSGISEPFAITPFTNSNQIYRVNESFNASDYMHSLALPENLNNNTVFFNQFLAAAVGTGLLSAYEDVGQITYEKIANFTSNHADIDTCNVDQLLSLAAITDTPASDYGASYPSEIKRLIDIASVNRSKLWGIGDNVPVLPRSTGNELNTQTSYITAGTRIILRSKLDNSYSLIPVPQLPPPDENTFIYPLSQLSGYGFVQPVLVNYQFFELDPQYDNTYLENIIDWDSPYTLLTPTASSFEEWYGPEGAIETMFRYVLTKNLFTK